MSSASKQAHAPDNLPPALLAVIRLLLLLALLAAAYLASVSLTGSTVAGCGPASGCDQVLHSRWAHWFGIPVSVPAGVAYLLVFALTFRLGRKTKSAAPAAQQAAWRWLILGAVMLLGAAFWFVALQLFAIKSFCPVCLTAHACGGGAAALLLGLVSCRSSSAKEAKPGNVLVSRSTIGKMALWGGVGLSVLVVGQMINQPKTFAVHTVVLGASPTNLSSTHIAPTNLAAREAVQPAPAQTNKVARKVPIVGGLFELNVDEVPVIGTPDAPYVMVSLFDYTCKGCRVMHGLLLEVHQALSNQLAIVNLPAPLDPACNPTLTRTPPEHTNACEYARLGLAVWRADRRVMPRFDEFMFGSPHPPPLEQSRWFAAQLVGTNQLQSALADPWVETQLRQSLSIYATNFYAFPPDGGNMPQLFVGKRITAGMLNGPPDLYKLLHEQLGMKAAAEKLGLPAEPTPKGQSP